MTGDAPRRKPEVFRVDDPDIVASPDPLPAATASDAGGAGAARNSDEASPRLATAATRRRGLRWGAILLAALSGLGGIALALSFARFVTIALERQDWIGWLSFGLLALAVLAFLVIIGRELVGLLRLRRLGRLKRELEAALARRDVGAEKQALQAIFGHLAERAELKWPLAALAEHARGVNDPGDLARLADRDVMPSLDGDARRLVAASARRVSVVSALSPAALITVGWVLAENLRLLRALATLYGGQPGFVGTTRLARMVFLHIVATGGVALTDDLLGQVLGQDLVRRLSRRLGESVFNAALTARVGAAAIEVIRPLPYLAAPRVRARDLIAEVVRLTRGAQATADKGNAAAGSS
jgi:putative membrane protein